MHKPAPKICYYCSSTSFGGLEMNIVRIVKWLKERGHQLLLLTPANSPIYKFAQKEKLLVEATTINKKYFDIKNARKLALTFKQRGIKMLVVGATRDVAFGSLVKRFARRKISLVYHSQMQLGISKRGLIHTLRYKMLDKWLVSLPYLKTEVGERTHFTVSKVDIVPLCIDTSYFLNYNMDKQVAREQLKLPQNLSLIGILGRIDPLKRQDFLVKALSELIKQGANAGLVIMGEPTRGIGSNYFEEVKKLISEFNLEEKVFFLPFSEETRPFFRAIDVFAMTTKGETFGMVTVEAMANKVPVVACNSGGSIEILEHGNLGYLYQPDNIADFCVQVKQVFNNNRQAMQKRAKAIEAVTEKYDKQIEIKAFEQLFNTYSE